MQRAGVLDRRPLLALNALLVGQNIVILIAEHMHPLLQIRHPQREHLQLLP